MSDSDDVLLLGGQLGRGGAVWSGQNVRFRAGFIEDRVGSESWFDDVIIMRCLVAKVPFCDTAGEKQIPPLRWLRSLRSR